MESAMVLLLKEESGVSVFIPSLGGTQYSASPCSSSLSKDDPSVTQPEEGGSMKLWLNVNSGSWCDTACV